jgi:membrane-associated HD superfamily phosphohydrolase
MSEISNSLPQGKSWAQVLQQDAPIQANMIDSFKKALVEVNEVDKEMELRSTGIVVYRAAESIRTNADESEQIRDEDLIKRLIHFLECDTDQLLSVHRLGKFSPERIAENKYRPLKVRFKTQAAQDQILNNLSNLRNAPRELHLLSIRQDLNYEQRQELNSKVQEAREMSKDKVDSFFRVRGNPGNYHLIEVKRRTTPFLRLSQGSIV